MPADIQKLWPSFQSHAGQRKMVAGNIQLQIAQNKVEKIHYVTVNLFMHILGQTNLFYRNYESF